MKRQLIIGMMIWVVVVLPTSGQIHTAQKYVNKQPETLFIGAVLEHKSLNKEAYTICETTINPLTVTFSTVGSLSQELSVPSYENMMEIVRGELSHTDEVKGNATFSYVVSEMASADAISRLWGQRVDEEKLFGLNERGCENRLLLDITQVYFTIGMDMSDAVTDAPDLQARAEELVYVSSLQFGRKATVVIESVIDVEKLKAVVSSAMNGEELSDKEQTILAGCTLRILQVDGGKISFDGYSDNPFTLLRNYFLRGATSEDFGVPIFFTAAYLSDNSIFENSY